MFGDKGLGRVGVGGAIRSRASFFRRQTAGDKQTLDIFRHRAGYIGVYTVPNCENAGIRKILSKLRQPRAVAA